MGLLNEIANNTYTPDSKMVITESMKILPTRERDGLPRNKIALNYAAREAGDCFWKCGVEIAKIFYIRLDSRYPLDDRKDPEKQKYHSAKMQQAKRILQERRNDIFEAVLPMFIISPRKKEDTDFGPADEAAHDYFVKNVFYMLIQTYDAWLPEFVEKDEEETTRDILHGMSRTQSVALSRLLKNFVFEYRPLVVQ